LLIGLPEFDFPPLDPLFYKYGKFVINSGDVHYQVIFSNVTIIGLSKIQFLSIRTNFLDDFFYLEVKGNIPKLFVKGDIRADGNLSGFRLANEGYYNVTAEDIRTAANLTGHVVNDTWIVEYIHLVMPIGKFKLYYNDAVNDKKAFAPVTCKRDSNDYSACLKQALEEGWLLIIKGLPEFDIPPLDPLVYENGKFELNSNEIRAELIFSNLIIIGLSKLHFPDVRPHRLNDVFRLEIDAIIPKLTLETDVKINGTLNTLMLKVAGEDHLNATAHDVRGTCDLTGHVINDTWIVEHFHIAPSIGTLKVYFDNLFEGNKELNNLALTFLNEYWPVFYRLMLPFISDILDPWLVGFANKFFSNVPLSNIFPVTTCKRDSVDYSACLKQAVIEALPRFVKGFPEFDFPPLEPIFYEYGKVVFDSGDIHAEVTVMNMSAAGLSKAQINDVRPHFLDDSFRLEVDAIVPNLILNGAVKMNGTIGIFRIVSKGPFNLTADDVIGTWDLSGHVVNDTLIVEHIRILPSVKKLKLYFDLFPDSKEINDIIVSFVNEFWPPLYRVMLPITSKAWDPWLTDLTNKLFSKVSFSKLFP
ncbi:hypothetical protein ALC62_01100, partial [Cyphomyrmex costatus]